MMFVVLDKSNDVLCTAANDPSGVKLSCTINNTYSSRGNYKCQANLENVWKKILSQLFLSRHCKTISISLKKLNLLCK